MKKTLAIFSPNKISYSETFIQAHKKLPFNIKFYYGGWLPVKLESSQSFFKFNLIQKIKIRRNGHFNLSEHALLYSLKKEKVDVVLAEYGPTACATLKVVEKLKLPLIVHFHGFDASVQSTLTEYSDQYKMLFSYASTVIVVSKKMKQMLSEIGCPIEKIHITVCGPDPSFFEIKPIYKLPQFISVGRFVDKKAPYLTIAAFKILVENYPDAKLVMIGDGRLLNACKNLAEIWDLNNNIDFLGVLTIEQIQAVMQESIAFVQHSIVADSGDSEGTPVAILEAQAAALPVISTLHAGIPDVVLDKETGFLVEEKDIKGMATHMLRILREEGLAKKLGEAGRRRIADNFSMDAHLRSIEIVINNSIKDK